MRVSIQVEFDVTAEDSEVTKGIAEAAAEQAVWDYLAFTTVTNANVGRGSVRVHVDGFGECLVVIAS